MPLLLQNPMFLVGSKTTAKGPRSPGPLQQPYQVVMALSFSCENLRHHLEESSPLTPPLSATSATAAAAAVAAAATATPAAADEHGLSSRILILDCRTFLAHSARHIVGAVNVHCPAILRRRLGNKLPLSTVISNREVRERLLKGLYTPVVLYEETASAGSDSMAAFVAKCLQNEAGINNVYILEGGFQQFWQQYPHLCVSAPTSTTSPRASAIWPPSLSPLSSLSRSSSSPALASTNNLPWYQQEQQDPVEILPYLFLGSEYHASNKATLQRLKITALLNVSQNCPNHFEDVFRYMAIPIEDSTNEDIGIWFRRAIEFINDVNASGGKVLVHCHAGISRSATICMAYLMATLRLRMEDAYELVKSRRKIISPNFSFMGQLLSFESQVFSPRGQVVGMGGGGGIVGGGLVGAQRSPRSPLTSLPCSHNNNNNNTGHLLLNGNGILNNNNSTTTGGSPSPRTADSPKTPSSAASTTTPTAFDFSISPSTLASLVNSSTATGGAGAVAGGGGAVGGGSVGGGTTSSPSPTPSPTTPLYPPSSPYST